MSCAVGKKNSKTRQFCKPYMGKSDVGLVTSNYKSKTKTLMFLKGLSSFYLMSPRALQ